MGQPVNGKGDPRTGQTELLPGSTTRQHSDFHNGPVAGDLGCGKIETRISPPGGRLPPRDGETAPRRTYPSGGRACGQRVAVWRPAGSIRPGARVIRRGEGSPS